MASDEAREEWLRRSAFMLRRYFSVLPFWGIVVVAGWWTGWIADHPRVGAGLLSVLAISLAIHLNLARTYFRERRVRDTLAREWWTVNEATVRFGDIIGVIGDSRRWRDALTQKHTGGGPLTHVALFVGVLGVVEAVPPRARTVRVSRYMASRGFPPFVVLRPRPEVIDFERDEGKADAIAYEVLHSGGNLYSFAKAVGFRARLVRRVAARDAFICSELVVRCYARAGVDLFPQAHGEVSPNSFLSTASLRDVTVECRRPVFPFERLYTLARAVLLRYARTPNSFGSAGTDALGDQA